MFHKQEDRDMIHDSSKQISKAKVIVSFLERKQELNVE